MIGKIGARSLTPVTRARRPGRHTPSRGSVNKSNEG